MPTFNGTAGDDIYTGGIDADTASGAGGNDSLSGAGGGDVLIGGPGADTLDGGDADDVLYSGDAPPPPYATYYPGDAQIEASLDRGSEVDNLKGGAGSDHIFAGYGDNVDGGSDGSWGDFLYISFQGAPSGVTADFGQMTQTIGGGVITDVENVDYVEGSNFDDKINMQSRTVGYTAGGTVHGMGGNDTLTAGYYTEKMYGDAGDDVVDGSASQYLFLVSGGAGNDTLTTNSNTFASVDGGAGDDTIYAHGAVHGGPGDDRIYMAWTYYNAPVYGDDGDDLIQAADTSNVIAGGAGADTILGGTGDDSLYSADFAGGGTTLPSDDVGAEQDVISGGAGNDALAIGYGDYADGGPGTDTLRISLAGADHGVAFDTTDLVAGTPTTLGGGVIQNIETLLSLRGSEFADTLSIATQTVQLTMNAGGGDDTIISHSSSVSVQGGAGDDRLVSGPAADIFDGGAGNDTVDYSLASSGVAVDLAGGAGAGGDSLFSVESVIGSGFADTLSGTAGANTISCGAGDDKVAAGAGNDTVDGGSGTDTLDGSDGADTVAGGPGPDQLLGGNGNDVLAGGLGDDTLIGGAGSDTAQYFDATSAVTVDLTNPAPQATGGAGTDQLSSIENLTGSAFDDVLLGDANGNYLGGAAGNDTLSGGEGGDNLEGGAGNDSLDGGAGADQASFDVAHAAFAIHTAMVGGVFVTTVQDTTGADGTDTVQNVETFTFNGSSFGFAGIQQNHTQNLDGNRFDDVLFQRTSTGTIYYQDMNGNASPGGFQNVLGGLPSGWKAVGSADINGDARADTIIQDTGTGSLYYVDQSGGGSAWGVITSNVGGNWQYVGAGDVTGDGSVDVVIRDSTTGLILYRDIAHANWGIVLNAGLGWKTVGVGDFNRDGFSDVAIQNASDGTVYYANMANGVFSGWGLITGAVGTAWKVVGTGDISGDGYADVVFQNQSTGVVYYVDMTGGAFNHWGMVAGLSGWTVRDVADLNNDGYADVVIQNNTDGTTYYANMQGGTFHGWGLVSGALGTDWVVV